MVVDWPEVPGRAVVVGPGSVGVVISAGTVVVSKTWSGASASVAHPRNTARMFCMLSPSRRGSSTELPWIVVPRASI